MPGGATLARAYGSRSNLYLCPAALCLYGPTVHLATCIVGPVSASATGQFTPYPPILSSVASTSSDNSSSAAAIFSRRCVTDDVPGINRIFGDRRSSHASATCMGVAFRLAATSDSVDDCNGVKPP